MKTQFFAEIVEKLQAIHNQESGLLGLSASGAELYSKIKEKIDIKQITNLVYETIGQIDAINNISFVGTGSPESVLDCISINQVNEQYNTLMAKKLVDIASQQGIEIKKRTEETSQSSQKAGITTDMLLIGGLIALGVLVLIRR
jgi:hypothetical protein